MNLRKTTLDGTIIYTILSKRAKRKQEYDAWIAAIKKRAREWLTSWSIMATVGALPALSVAHVA